MLPNPAIHTAVPHPGTLLDRLEQALGRDDAAAALDQVQQLRQALAGTGGGPPMSQPDLGAQRDRARALLRRLQTRAAAAQRLTSLLLPATDGPALYGPDGLIQATRPALGAVA